MSEPVFLQLLVCEDDSVLLYGETPVAIDIDAIIPEQVLIEQGTNESIYISLQDPYQMDLTNLTPEQINMRTVCNILIVPSIPVIGPKGDKGDKGDQGAPGTAKGQWGTKQTGVDAGSLGEFYIDNDYIYACVVEGPAGVAVWKRSVLFTTS